MQNDQDEIDYEVGQEQLDAVDRMLEELDMDEQFDRGKVHRTSIHLSLSLAVGMHTSLQGTKRQHSSSFNYPLGVQ
jgi:hypothetical protein